MKNNLFKLLVMLCAVIFAPSVMASGTVPASTLYTTITGTNGGGYSCGVYNSLSYGVATPTTHALACASMVNYWSGAGYCGVTVEASPTAGKCVVTSASVNGGLPQTLTSGLTASSPSCPANSVLSGASCACNTGYSPDSAGTSCVLDTATPPPSACTSPQVLDSATNTCVTPPPSGSGSGSGNGSGFLSAGVCFDTSALAVDNHFSSISPVSVVDYASGIIKRTSYVNDLGVWKYQQVSVSSAGAETVVYSVSAAAPVFMSCYSPTQSFSDGVSIGWAVSGVLVLCLFVVMINRTLGKHV